jgi:hypothetical protein
MKRFLLSLMLISAAAAGAQAPARRDMTALSKDFKAAPVPAKSALLGRWILVTNVNTEHFITGRDGPDRVLAVPSGVRDSAGKAYWTLEFRRGRNSRLTLTSDAAFVGEYSPPMSFNARGELTFSQDYGGDSGYLYRCRMPNANTLICLEAHPGHGVEFRRMTAKDK